MSGENEKPPFLKNWTNVYALVIINLLITIIVFGLITYYYQ